MTGTHREPESADLRAWAARQLGVAPNTGEDEVRHGFLRRLPDAEFVPPWEEQGAAAVLTGRSPTRTTRLVAAREEEVRLRVEVEEFAAEFFMLPPAERKRRWLALSEACTFTVPLTARLYRLGAGLDVELPAERCTPVGQLAGYVAELFVLRPAERAFRRQAILQQIRADPACWERAAQQLRKQHADVASLENDWILKLAARSKRQAQESKGLQRLARKPASQSIGFGSNYQFIVAIVFALCIVLRFFIVGNSYSPRYSPRGQPAFPKPTWRINSTQSSPQEKIASQVGAKGGLLDVWEKELASLPKGAKLPKNNSRPGEATRRLLGIETAEDARRLRESLDKK